MLVIFDCDGVLVDSEPLAAEVFAESLQAVGVPFTAEQCHSTFCGWTLPQCFDHITSLGYDLPADFPQRLFEREHRVFTERLQPVQGIVSVLSELKQNALSYCVASNGSLKKVERSLAITGLDRLFPPEHIFSAEFVAKGKPSPDLFLYAAESMGVPVPYCVVVEDSAAGMCAAQAAGMRVLCYGNDGNALPGIRAFKRMATLPELLGGMQDL